jgi:hypothetical protein
MVATRQSLRSDWEGDVMGWLSTKKKEEDWEYSVVLAGDEVLTTDSKEEAEAKLQELQASGNHHANILRGKKAAAK